jgi:hypothetical protein
MEYRVTHGQAVTQSRRHPRVRVSAPFPFSFARVGLKKWLSPERSGVGVVYDVSRKGARVMTEAAMHPGDQLAIRLHLPNQIPCMLVERAVVRWGKDQTYGVEFHRYSSVADMRLRKFLQQASIAVPASSA